MKVISREVTLYNYTFGKYDVFTGKIMEPQTVTRTAPFGQRELAAYTKDSGLAMVHAEEFSRKYELPLDLFIAACEAYAEKTEDAAITAKSDGEEAAN